MQFYEAVEARRSVRRFSSAPVEREKIGRILEAARQSPSWSNRQCWRFILVSDPALKASLGEQAKNPNAQSYADAPYALAVCADPTDSGVTGGKEYYLADCGAAMQSIMLAAAAEGLGTCFVGGFSEYAVRMLLNIPEDIRVVAITPLGYSSDLPAKRLRLPLDTLAYENGWKNEYKG